MPSSETRSTTIPPSEVNTASMPTSGTDPAIMPLSEHYRRANRLVSMITLIWVIILITTIFVLHLPSTTGIFAIIIAATWLFAFVLLFATTIISSRFSGQSCFHWSVSCPAVTTGTMMEANAGAARIALGMIGILVWGLFVDVSVKFFRDWNGDLNWESIFEQLERARPSHTQRIQPQEDQAQRGPSTA
ncbi:hypothetical protein EV702DRAFT_1042295 [Suillus placidus]|uniref:Uncharacterized protein n=1 Tax=Suillus placidus TaxID=48579 RepID=A0A9P7A2Z8_9AGAM|nr:hypothetical protein EV702DRAFT_1042295 [Suillus placidus]